MKKLLCVLAAAIALPSGATAGTNVVTGVIRGQTFTAESTIIGFNSTATVSGGGDPQYLGTNDFYRGTVGLLIDEGPAGQFVCSGSLSANRANIITAGHCVTDSSGSRPVSVTAYFYNPVTPDPLETPIYNPGAPNVTTVGIDAIYVNTLYTGQVIDDHDISVLHLAGNAPSFATAYQLYTGTDLTGLVYNTAGYGRRSQEGGSVGVDLGTGRLRQGDNRYDFRAGDPDFKGELISDLNFFGNADKVNTYLADFDNGTSARDASCILATSPEPKGYGIAVSGKYCNTGLGTREALTAPGDSGGPQFINGKLASITSFGLTFGSSYGDIDNTLNDSFGEFNGLVPIYSNLDFINAALSASPEPDAWLLMVAGVGMMGATLRRVRRTKPAEA